MKLPLGSPLPPGDEHAVSVHLPAWKDTVGWAVRDPSTVQAMKTGYPRFFIPRIVHQLANRLIEHATVKHAADVESRRIPTNPGRTALLFPSEAMARACEGYFQKETQNFATLHISFAGNVHILPDPQSENRRCGHDETFAVVYSPDEAAAAAKSFWQHTGFGISSRCAKFWLENAPFLQGSKEAIMRTPDLPFQKAKTAQATIRSRIASSTSSTTNVVTADDVYLYPTGMSAMSHTAMALRLRTVRKRTCRVATFGFLYVDTLKVLEKVYGFEVILYGYATTADMDALERDLMDGTKIDAVYTEFPGNPLLRSVDLDRLYKLGKDHNFLVIVDNTVATTVNVDLISSCDILCTSLTKMFSGACNVMGGSLTLNPQSEHSGTMKEMLTAQHIDTYFPQDVLEMDRNSADFTERVTMASKNAESVAEMIRKHPAVDTLYYPKGHESQGIYDRYKRPDGGYGFLLSITFVRPEAAIAFHDAMDVAKGPSLGTNFTLCCAHTSFAHFSELEWAAKFGVVEHLVRISVGIEKTEILHGLVQKALDAAAESWIRVAKNENLSNGT